MVRLIQDTLSCHLIEALSLLFPFASVMSGKAAKIMDLKYIHITTLPAKVWPNKQNRKNSENGKEIRGEKEKPAKNINK